MHIHENILHLFFTILHFVSVENTYNTKLTHKVDIDVNANNKLYRCNIRNNIILIE